MLQLMFNMRMEAGFTQKYLADNVGKSPSWLHQMESGKMSVTADAFEAYADGCGYDVKIDVINRFRDPERVAMMEELEQLTKAMHVSDLAKIIMLARTITKIPPLFKEAWFQAIAKFA